MPEAARIHARRADTVAIAALAALTLVFFGRMLFTDQALFWGDIMMGHYPAYDLWRQGMAAGSLALWNPFILGGFPQAADATSGYFYPTILLHLVMPLHRALAVDLALHVFMAGAFTYLFLRRQDIAAGPALVGAMIFAFSGYMAVHVIQPPVIRSAAWLPLLLWIVATLNSRPRGRSALYLGVILAGQLLAGHHQTVLISALLLGSYAVWGTIHRTDAGGRPLRALAVPVAAFALAIVVALVLAAVQLIPAWELAQKSDRSGGMNFEHATVLSFPPEQLPMLLAPKLFGDPTTGRYWGTEHYWEMTGYAGLVSIVLALLGAVVSIRRDRIFWTAAALAGIALALGRYSPLYWLAYYMIPGLSYFRVPARFLLWFGFAVATLAAYGMDALRSGTGSRSAWRWVGACLIAGSAAAAWWALDAPGVRSGIGWLTTPAFRSFAAAAPPEVVRYLQETGVSEGRRFALLWTLGGIAVLAVRTRRIAFRACVPAVALLVGIDLFTFGMNIYPTVEAQALSRPVPTESVLDLEQGTYRIIMTPAFVNETWTRYMTRSFVQAEPDWLFNYRAAFMPNTNVHRQISNAYGNSPIYLRQMGQFLGTAMQQAQRGDGRSPLLDFMGARYVFTFADMGHIYQQAYRGGFSVWRNDRAMPRGWLATHYEVLETDAQIARAFRGGWDPGQTVILSRPPDDTFGLRPGSDPGRITRRSYGPTQVAFDLALAGPAIFVLSDAYYPGWRAYVDGVPHPIYRANHAFRAVVLPAGARHLEFVYRPGSVVAGGIISGAGWLAVVMLWIISAARERVSRNALAGRG